MVTSRRRSRDVNNSFTFELVPSAGPPVSAGCVAAAVAVAAAAAAANDDDDDDAIDKDAGRGTS